MWKTKCDNQTILESCSPYIVGSNLPHNGILSGKVHAFNTMLFLYFLPCTQEQLAAFEADRLALLGRSKDAQKEMDKLSQQYAKLLGHQNQKQKIRHVLKLKEENNTLKQVRAVWSSPVRNTAL